MQTGSISTGIAGSTDEESEPSIECGCCCYDNCVSPAINLPLTRAECARDLRPLCTGPCSPRAGSSSLFAQHKSLAQQPTCLCGMRAFCLSRALMLETCARATRHFYFSAARARRRHVVILRW
jgi:hypothetical protein